MINGQVEVSKAERAGDSFFKGINTQMYKMRINLD